MRWALSAFLKSRLLWIISKGIRMTLLTERSAWSEMFGDRSRIRKVAIVENRVAMLPKALVEMALGLALISFNLQYHLLWFFLIVFIFLNMFLHLAQIYANSFNLISFTYMKMTAEHGSKCRFLSLIFNVSNIIHHFTFVFFLSFFFFYQSSCRKDHFTVSNVYVAVNFLSQIIFIFPLFQLH